MAGTPKQKAEELTDRLNIIGSCLMAGERLDEFAWRKLLNDAIALGRVASQEPFSLKLQAVLWGFKADVAQAEKYFQICAGKFGKDWDWYHTRFMQGPLLGRLNMVTDFLELDIPKDHKIILSEVASICNQSGLFLTARAALNQLQKLGVEDLDEFTAANTQSVRSAAKYLDEHQLDEMDIARRLEVATRVMLDKKVRLTNFSIVANDFGITFEYVLDEDIERLIDYDIEISRAITEQFDDVLSQHISIGTAPMEAVS